MTSESSPRSAGAIIARAALVCGVVGLVIGLVRGLTVYVPTAWAAMFEVGIPSACIGVALGLGFVGARVAVRRLRARRG
jgi:hypothetical protein